MNQGPDPLLQWLSNAGSLGILAAACVAFIRGWIVPGSAHARVLSRLDRANDIADAAIENAERERKMLASLLEEERARNRGR